MTTLKDMFDVFMVRPETAAGLALATDGIKTESRVAMIAIHPLDGEPFSVFVRGADIAATRQYHGIPDEVYHSLALDPEDVKDALQQQLDLQGIHTVIAHRAFKFVRDRLLDQKLISNSLSFLDTAIVDKTVTYWNSRLRESSNLLELQARVTRMRGGNTCKMDVLLNKYDVQPIPEGELSPYIPENNARLAAELLQRQLDTELAF
jgi:hypothetical protein